MSFNLSTTQSIILESVKKSYTRKYKCPFCETRLEKAKLVSHIDKKHEDMIPEGFTAARIVFNTANKKETGHCVICGKETKWNENNWRYERYCSEACKNKASAIAKSNMVKVYGKEHLLNDVEMQNKMLKNRSISGTYKFTHGGSIDYVGSYEKKLLEFLDKVMGFRSIDIMSPGPTIEYEYKGQKHVWITDQYLVPFNLVFDVKDGGNNPNNRPMDDYREKQIAKEKAIADLKKYNYIRLTDNQFDQLLLILAELKEQMMDLTEDKEPIIRINESVALDEYCAAAMGALVGINTKSNTKTYVVPYMMKNSFCPDYGITDDPTLDHTVISDIEGNMKLVSRDFFKNECSAYSLYEYTGPVLENKINWDTTNLLEVVTGKHILHPDQLLYDKNFVRLETTEEHNKMVVDCLEATILSEDVKFPVLVKELLFEESVMAYEDSNGYYLENINTKLRSKSYSSIEDICNKNLINYISIGTL